MPDEISKVIVAFGGAGGIGAETSARLPRRARASSSPI